MLTGRVDSVHKREHALCALQSESPSPARARPTVSRPTPSPDAHDSLRARPLNLGAFPQAADRRSHLRSLCSVERVRAARNSLLAGLAVPDAGRHALDRVLATEDARVRRVLRDLHLFDSLPQRGAIPHTVLAGDASLLGPLVHHGWTARGAGGGRGTGRTSVDSARVAPPAPSLAASRGLTLATARHAARSRGSERWRVERRHAARRGGRALFVCGAPLAPACGKRSESCLWRRT